jgi:hypothetical protein
MAITEHLTYMQTRVITIQKINSNGTWPGYIVDTKNYDNGFAYALLILGSSIDVGSETIFTTSFEHGVDPALADAESVPSEMMVYGSSNNGVTPYIVGHMPYAPSPAAVLSQEAFHSTKRYMRANFTVTNFNGTVNGAEVSIYAIQHPNLVPTPQRLGFISDT